MIQLKSLFVLAMVASLSACSSFPDKGSDADFSDPEVTEDTAPGLEGNQSGVQVYSANQGQQTQGRNTANSHQVDSQRLDTPQDVVAFEPIVYFDLDQYELDDKSLETVKFFSHRMLESYNLQVKITGHTDERGTPEYNLALGEKRAKSVEQAMALYGVDSSRIEVISLGEESPVDIDSNEAAWQKNRRAEFRIY